MIAAILVLVMSFWMGKRLYNTFRTPNRTALWLRLGDSNIEESVSVMSLCFPLNFYQFNVSKQVWRPQIYDSGVYSNLLWGDIHLKLLFTKGPRHGNCHSC